MKRSIANRLRAAVPLAAALALAATTTAALASPSPRHAQQQVPATQRLAVLNHDTQAFRKPSTGSGSAGEVNEVRPITGERTVLPVVASTDVRGQQWLEVLLPGRPDSHTGWIQAASASPAATHWRLIVNLSTRRVAVYYNGRLTRTFLAVVGKPSTPTPTGSFFVEETAPLAAQAAGAPFALALSARSNALAQFDGGPGQVALHGIANIGGTPGTAVSHGCVRLTTTDISWLATRISSGVPVTITN